MNSQTTPGDSSAQSAAADQNHAPGADSVADAVREAVASQRDVAERVRGIVVDLFRGRTGTVAAARQSIRDVLETASEIVRKSAPQADDSRLKQVIDGVMNGLSTVANSAQFAVQEAASRGQRFAAEDLTRARQDLQGVSEILKETVQYFAGRAATESRTVFDELKTHAERAAAAIGPVLKSTLDAVGRHPVATVSEAAGSVVRGGQLTAGALLNAMSGLLAGAAELLEPGGARQPASPVTPEHPEAPRDAAGTSP